MTKQIKALETYRGIDQTLLTLRQGAPKKSLGSTIFETFNL